MYKINEKAQVLLVDKGEVVMEMEVLVDATTPKEESEPLNGHGMNNNEASTRYHWF